MRKTLKANNNYEIDTNGKVYDKRTGRKVREEVNVCGYSYVMLDGRMHTVAYLMKASFFPNDHNICIRHNDGDRRNNSLDNLTTLYEGTDKKVLVMEADKDTNEVVKLWDSAKECARAYNIKSIISKIRNHTPLPNGNYIEVYNSGIDGVGLFDYSDGKHKIKVISLDGVNGVFDTVKEVSEATGQCASAIFGVLEGKLSSINGYYFRWILSTTPAKENDKNSRKNKVRKTPAAKMQDVSQFSLDGKLIRTYASLNEASRMTGIGIGNISNCIHKKLRQAGGYFWAMGSDSVTVDVLELQKYPRAVARCEKDKDGNMVIVDTWRSRIKASEATGIPVSTLKYQITHRKGKPAADGYYYIELE